MVLDQRTPTIYVAPLDGGDGRVVARRGWGWAGTVHRFLTSDHHDVLGSLEAHHRELLTIPPSGGQRRAWEDELSVLEAALRRVEGAAEGGLALEYELPMEGRRPDAVLLANSQVLVLEFKSSMVWSAAHLDQVEAYARDLSEYHEATHGLRSMPILVLARSAAAARSRDGVTVTGGGALANVLRADPPPCRQVPSCVVWSAIPQVRAGFANRLVSNAVACRPVPPCSATSR